MATYPTVLLTLAFATAATAQWLANLAALTILRGITTIYILTTGLTAVFAVLFLLGFRQRAGLTTGAAPLLGAVAAAVLAVAGVLFPLSAFVLRSVPSLVLLAVMIGLCVNTMVGCSRRPNPAERTAIVVLSGFAIVSITMAVFAISAFVTNTLWELGLYHVALLLVLPGAFIAVGLAAVFLLAADLAENMRLLATVDPLTGVLNRRGLFQAATVAIANCQRQRQPIVVVIADLDRFKLINDAFGHAAGDAALRAFTQHICRSVRVGDPIGRIGGEEFAFLLVNTAEASAVEVVERIRAGMTMLVLAGDADAKMTASFGVAAISPGEAGIDEALDRADVALYASKLAGRNRVTLADGQPSL